MGKRRGQSERIKPLAEEKAVSLKDLDDAVDNERESEAAVAFGHRHGGQGPPRPGVHEGPLPITGIAGIARAQIGNLVGPGSIEELTTVSTVDPIKVYIPMSEQEFLRNVEGGGGRAERMELELILADGTVYPEKGTFAFADREVDIKTGTIKVAITFPNPGNKLRPGQFAKVRALTAMKKGPSSYPRGPWPSFREDTRLPWWISVTGSRSDP